MRNLKFIWIDCLFLFHYCWKNPHQISKAFLKSQGEKNVYGFGETPLTTLDLIARECAIVSKDTVFELGCGSARSCFWLNIFVKCRVIGIDFVPTFIQKGDQIKKWANISHLQLIQENFLKTDLSQATVIYLYGTCLEEEMIFELAKLFENLKPRTKVITVSYPLTEYSDAFDVKKHFEGRFPWGKADIFLNEKKSIS